MLKWHIQNDAAVHVTDVILVQKARSQFDGWAKAFFFRWECTAKSMQMDYFFLWQSNMNMDIQLWCLGVIRKGDAKPQWQEGQYVLA